MKGKLVPVYAMKVHSESTVIALPILKS